MMNKDEAVLKLARQALISTSHAEDLYDSIIPKPVVKQCVADWYEGHKDDLNEDVRAYLASWADTKWDEFKYWMYHAGRNEAITTIVNMHQFGYEVEGEKQYTVRIKAVLGQYLGRYYLNNEELTPQFTRTHFTEDEERPTFTRKELESNGFGWVFNCEGVEVKEVE